MEANGHLVGRTDLAEGQQEGSIQGERLSLHPVNALGARDEVERRSCEALVVDGGSRCFGAASEEEIRVPCASASDGLPAPAVVSAPKFE